MSKGEEVRGEMELVAKMLASVKGPDAKGLRPVVLSVSTVRSHSVTGHVWSAKVSFGTLL